MQALYQWDITGQDYADIESLFPFDDRDRDMDVEYFRRLIQAVPRHRDTIEKQIGPYLDRPFAGVDPVERAILRLAAYELEWERDIPVGVIIDEAVRIAKTFAGENSFRFVNGVLDKLGHAVRTPG